MGHIPDSKVHGANMGPIWGRQDRSESRSRGHDLLTFWMGTESRRFMFSQNGWQIISPFRSFCLNRNTWISFCLLNSGKDLKHNVSNGWVKCLQNKQARVIVESSHGQPPWHIAPSDQMLSYALTHWSRDKMAAISQTMSSNAFSWMKMYEFRLIFHWRLFLGGPINNIPTLV